MCIKNIFIVEFEFFLGSTLGSVELRNIVKIFPPNTVAVNNINLKINDGEFFILLGPSGCGKTTTLRIIAGLEKPTKGRVYIDNVDVTDLPPRKRDVAMVFQTWALYPHMKVYDNIAFPLKLRKVPKDEIDRKVKEVAKMLQIESLLDRYPRQLSGGQQQRVALARALVRKPKVWLLDEPLSNLDAILRVQMRAELKKLQKELKITAVYVTHDQVEAMSMADRVAVMNAGRVLQVGRPEEVYRKPNTLFVARFIGSPPMNFLRVSLVEEGGKYYLRSEGVNIELPRELGEVISKNASDPKDLILGVRPEHLELTTVDKAHISGDVYIIEPLGSETIINIKVGDTVIKARSLGEVTLSIGERIFLRADINNIHVFDPKTEKAII